MATTTAPKSVPKQSTRPPLPPPGPPNYIIMTPYPFAPSKRELLEKERQSRGDGKADALDK